MAAAGVDFILLMADGANHRLGDPMGQFRLLKAFGAGRLGADVLVKLETCLVGLSVHWRKVPAAQAGHNVLPQLAVTKEETEAQG